MKIQIKVNEKTSPIIQKILFEKGYSWSGVREVKYVESPWLFARPAASLAHGRYKEDFREEGSLYIDASAQLGELLDLLDKKEITVKDVAFSKDLAFQGAIVVGERGADAVISADKTYLTIRCSIVSKEKVKEVYEKMFG